MFTQKIFCSRIFIIGVLGAFLLFAIPVAPFAKVKAPPAPANGSLVGFIYAKDMRTPVRNAIVKLRNIAKGTDYESEPTDDNGMYEITGIEEGRYIMGVTAQNGNYNFYYSLLLKGNEIAKLSVALQQGGDTGGRDTGKGKTFFEKAGGIVVLVIVGGSLLTYVLLNKEEASPVIR
jgi:hypothetical protein